jgi:hypothetical protein
MSTWVRKLPKIQAIEIIMLAVSRELRAAPISIPKPITSGVITAM